MDDLQISSLKQQIIQLNLKLANQTLDSSDYSSHIQKISDLNTQILSAKINLIKLKAEEAILLQNSPINYEEQKSFQNRIKSLQEGIQKASNLRLQKIEQCLKSFQGKPSLKSQLKSLLSKERENSDLKNKLKAILASKNCLQIDYCQITKKLSDDNTLSLKIKNYENQITGKVDQINTKKIQLDAVNEKIENIKSNSTRLELKKILSDIESIKLQRQESLETVQKLKNDLKDLKSDPEDSKKSENERKNSSDMNRNDIKFFENQITDKEKEIKVLISIKKEMNSKYSNTLKQLKFIDSGKSHNKNASFSIKTPQFNDLSANESIKSKSQASLLAQKESSSKIIGENTYLKLAADKNTGKEGKLSNIKKNN